MGVTEYPSSVKVVGRLAIDCDDSDAGISEGHKHHGLNVSSGL